MGSGRTNKNRELGIVSEVRKKITLLQPAGNYPINSCAEICFIREIFFTITSLLIMLLFPTVHQLKIKA